MKLYHCNINTRDSTIIKKNCSKMKSNESSVKVCLGKTLSERDQSAHNVWALLPPKIHRNVWCHFRASYLALQKQPNLSNNTAPQRDISGSILLKRNNPELHVHSLWAQHPLLLMFPSSFQLYCHSIMLFPKPSTLLPAVAQLVLDYSAYIIVSPHLPVSFVLPQPLLICVCTFNSPGSVRAGACCDPLCLPNV